MFIGKEDFRSEIGSSSVEISKTRHGDLGRKKSIIRIHPNQFQTLRQQDREKGLEKSGERERERSLHRSFALPIWRRGSPLSVRQSCFEERERVIGDETLKTPRESFDLMASKVIKWLKLDSKCTDTPKTQKIDSKSKSGSQTERKTDFIIFKTKKSPSVESNPRPRD